jgi:hypothetical protein
MTDLRKKRFQAFRTGMAYSDFDGVWFGRKYLILRKAEKERRRRLVPNT